MPSETLRVVAHITARPDTVEETKKILLDLIGPTRAEEGCVTYELLQNNADPTDLTFIEEWSGDEALDAHLATPHIQNALERFGELLAASPDIRRYTLIG